MIDRQIHNVPAFELRSPGQTRGRLFRSIDEAIVGALDEAEPEEKDKGMPTVRIKTYRDGKLIEERILYGDEEPA